MSSYPSKWGVPGVKDGVAGGWHACLCEFTRIVVFLRGCRISPFSCCFGWGLDVSVELGTVLSLVLVISCFAL